MWNKFVLSCVPETVASGKITSTPRSHLEAAEGGQTPECFDT